MPQYALPLSLPPVFSEDNFLLSDCNREAHRFVSAWPEWGASALLLYGPAGSGKTHLGRIWAARADASLHDTLPAPDALRGNALIENIDRAADQALLFHLLNYSKERGQCLLLTSRSAPSQLPFTLPDLTSRLLALPAASIHAPDDEALAAAIRKQFADRQLKVEDEVIAYILARMERSFAYAAETVETLDRAALSERRAVTVPFLKRVMGW